MDESNRRSLWSGWGTAFLTLGAGALFAVGGGALRPSWQGPAVVVGVVCLVLSGTIFAVTVWPDVRPPVQRVRKKWSMWREYRRVRAARFEQINQCENGHQFSVLIAPRKENPSTYALGQGSDWKCPLCGVDSPHIWIESRPANDTAMEIYKSKREPPEFEPRQHLDESGELVLSFSNARGQHSAPLEWTCRVTDPRGGTQFEVSSAPAFIFRDRAEVRYPRDFTGAPPLPMASGEYVVEWWRTHWTHGGAGTAFQRPAGRATFFVTEDQRLERVRLADYP